MEKTQSCLNYTGGKYKLLDQILPLFPTNINTFLDLFCGGASVAINVIANEIKCYDNINEITELFNFIKNNEVQYIIEEIENIIKEYGLSSTYENGYLYYNCNADSGMSRYNKKPYMKLRDDFNNNRYKTYDEKILWFYTLIIFGFNNQIRFNRKGYYNMPVGKRDFNSRLRNKLINFSKKIKSININFQASDFRNVNLDNLNKDDLVYIDPPYLITIASYNEQGGWTEKDERELLMLLDSISDRGIKFALSNVLECKGKINNILIEWSKKYKVHYLDYNYNFSNYHIKDKTSKTIEVLICNY